MGIGSENYKKLFKSDEKGGTIRSRPRMLTKSPQVEGLYCPDNRRPATLLDTIEEQE